MSAGVKAPPTTDSSPPSPKYVIRSQQSEGASVLCETVDTDRQLWKLLDFHVTERKAFKVEVFRTQLDL